MKARGKYTLNANVQILVGALGFSPPHSDKWIDNYEKEQKKLFDWGYV